MEDYDVCLAAAAIAFLLATYADVEHADQLGLAVGRALDNYLQSGMQLDNWLFVSGASEEEIEMILGQRGEDYGRD